MSLKPQRAPRNTYSVYQEIRMMNSNAPQIADFASFCSDIHVHLTLFFLFNDYPLKKKKIQNSFNTIENPPIPYVTRC